MRIAILGSGNGGCAIAAECALQEHDVRIFDFEKFPTNIEAIEKANGIKCTGSLEGFAPISYAGHEINATVDNAQLIFVVGPSYSTVPFARIYKTVMREGQNIIICPGTN